MNQFQMDHQALYRLLEIKCERETVDGVLQGIREFLPEEDMLEAEQVCAYLQAPDKPTALSHHQQMVAMDKLLECAGVNFRTCCDLLRYQQMKKAGIVQPWISSCSWYILMNRRRNRMKISEYKSYDDLPLFLNAASLLPNPPKSSPRLEQSATAICATLSGRFRM